MSKKKEKTNPRGKPSREEIQVYVSRVSDNLIACLSGLTDFLVEKKVISVDEFTAFMATRFPGIPTPDSGPVIEGQAPPPNGALPAEAEPLQLATGENPDGVST